MSRYAEESVKITLDPWQGPDEYLVFIDERECGSVSKDDRHPDSAKPWLVMGDSVEVISEGHWFATFEEAKTWVEDFRNKDFFEPEPVSW